MIKNYAHLHCDWMGCSEYQAVLTRLELKMRSTITIESVVETMPAGWKQIGDLTYCPQHAKETKCNHNWVMEGHNAGDPICSKCYSRNA